ncbi:hypothetical protein OG379_41085 (plasmid) [Streptomyces sp. NBC_01166]|uniref:hypothetical protein n=1 Tax=Streptomyces sp. NBC_01166 TaxID=2903755 RepID=UPI002F9120F2|nr:hypothetical protein OG379_41085 [Streptomyces sp. NBC_01166]
MAVSASITPSTTCGHDLATRQELMAPRAVARLDAIERARRGEGPAYLITPT